MISVEIFAGCMALQSPPGFCKVVAVWPFLSTWAVWVGPKCVLILSVRCLNVGKDGAPFCFAYGASFCYRGVGGVRGGCLGQWRN